MSLRLLKDTDAPHIVQSLNDPDVVRFLSANIPQPYRDADAQWWITRGSQQSGTVRAIEFNGVFCGVIGARYSTESDHTSAELGYWLSQPHWGKGIATQAMGRFSRLMFSTTGITHLFNPVTVENVASIRVMQKAGYTLERVLHLTALHGGHAYDEHVYGKTKT